MANTAAKPTASDGAFENREAQTSNSSTRTLTPRESDESQEKNSRHLPAEAEIANEEPKEKRTVQAMAISPNESQLDVSKQPEMDEKADLEGAAPIGPSAEVDEAEENFKPKTVTFWLVILSNFVAMFLVALDRTIIATAIPRITDEFQSLGDIGWYGSAYMLTTAASQLVFGRIYKFYNLRVQVHQVGKGSALADTLEPGHS
ncbi:hypothetical protein CTA2_2361 [Colletotrichum tanaceti]|uniref:Major facilitator superfamily (MFS) profile domain-containing protein n=1 Tax=Colletotrichum tanaceti TaxID=1306861 RepID=A0A4U6XD20_9PEZI|nr:hypothetical protein CTA2_2361 [Colletotrichum tanaceti]TKW53651.1 hypothetical protein CTA1_6943 [Colletotrichum tanaceti]